MCSTTGRRCLLRTRWSARATLPSWPHSQVIVRHKGLTPVARIGRNLRFHGGARRERWTTALRSRRGALSCRDPAIHKAPVGPSRYLPLYARLGCRGLGARAFSPRRRSFAPRGVCDEVSERIRYGRQ